MNKPTRVLTAILVSLVLGGMFAYQDAQKNAPPYQQHPVTVVATDFFCGALSGLICYLGSGLLARRKERKLKQAEDDNFYDEVARELQEKKLVAGLWTKAYAEMGGDDAKARALYIKYRAAQLAEANRQRRGDQQPEAQAEQSNPLEPAKQIANASTKSKPGVILAVLAGVVIVIVILVNSGNNSTSTTSSISTGSKNPSDGSNPNYTSDTPVSSPLPPPAKVAPAIQPQEEIQFNNDKRLAESGNATAQFCLGLDYSSQTTNFAVGGKDDAESAKWLSKAAEQGMVNAQVEIGRAYYSGRGVNVDKNQAVNWFRKAAEQGSLDGAICLGLCYKYGDGVPVNADEAVKCLTQAANQNNAIAQFELGCCYSEYGGIDYVNKNNVVAYKWLSLAKAQGKQGTMDDRPGMDALEYVAFYLSPEQKAEAQKLAADFVPEHSTLQDSQADTSAVNKIKKDKKLAEGGDVQAALRLGICYKNGDGVPENADEAVKWLTQAANQNDATAQFELGCCYSEYGGINYVNKNNILAYKWLSLAKAQGKQGTIDGKMGMDALEYVSFYLSPDQKSQAQKLSADFVPQNDNPK